MSETACLVVVFDPSGQTQPPTPIRNPGVVSARLSVSPTITRESLNETARRLTELLLEQIINKVTAA